MFSEILVFLPRKSVYQCMQVSKLWFNYSASAFYGNLVLNGNHIKRLEHYLVIHKSIGDAGITKYGYLVRQLKIQDDDPRSLANPHLILGTILSFLPNITKIDLSCSVDCIPYLYNLTHLKSLKSIKNIEHIKVFNKDVITNIGGNRKIKDYYLSACFTFRETLTHLELLEPFKNFNIDDVRGVNYLNVLSNFPKLRHLIVYYNMENRQNAHMIYPSILSICPNLVGFTLACRTRQSESAITHPSNCINKNRIAQYPMSNATNLKYLSLTLPTLDKFQMAYIVSNVRACRLEKLVLNFDHWDTLNYWIPNCNLAKVKNFARHLSLAENLEITIVQGPFKQDIKLLSSSPSKLDLVKIYLQMYKLFDLLRAFQGNRNYSHFEITGTIIIKREKEKFREISLIRSRIFNRVIELEQTIDAQFFCKRSNNILTAKFGNGISIRTHLKKVKILVWLENFVNILEFVLRKCLFATHIIFEVFNPHGNEKPAYLEIEFPTTFRPDEDPRWSPVIKMDYALIHPVILASLSACLPLMTELTFTNVTKQNIERSPLQLHSIEYLRHLVFEFTSTGKVPDHSLYFELHFIAEDDNKQSVFHKYLIDYFDETFAAKHFNELYSAHNPSIVASYTHIDIVSVRLDGKLVRTISVPPILPGRPKIKKFVDRILHGRKF
ncbi:hypothetical protein BDF21DRAFT_34952 [Thamnidium elegans]|nr:hypothetical protein BDF21DRAFT_34952 [Thamnidium elegans]